MQAFYGAIPIHIYTDDNLCHHSRDRVRRRIFVHYPRALVEGKFVVFIRNTDRLFEIFRYINRNETGCNILLVHCEDKNSFHRVQEILPILKEAGLYPHFTITSIFINRTFGPAVIEQISKKYKIHKNRMLIGSIHHHHPFEYDELGGVRIIF